MIFGGIISLVTGLIMVLWPGKTLLFLAVLIGVWLLIIGIVRIIQAFTLKKRILIGVSGLLYVVVGAICLRDMFTSVTLLAVIMGLVWTVGGAAEVAAGYPKLGLLTMAAGVIVFLYPKPSLLAVSTIAGVWLITKGLIETLSDVRGGQDRASRDAATSAVA